MQSWEKTYRKVEAGLLSAVPKAADLAALEGLRVSYLGRKGSLTQLLKSLKDLPLEDRKRLGPLANGLKERTEALLEEKLKSLQRSGFEGEIRKASLDLTLPSYFHRTLAAAGHLHPVTQTLREMTDILRSLGFGYAEGPLVETDYYNFEALNIPPEHPARDMQDTFYLAAPFSLLMRTHTSPVQIRRMESSRPPVRIMAPGRVFRHEAVDASHSAVFHQVEGLYVDRKVSMADLKGTLDLFLKGLFGPGAQIRFRPSYFPFTEPSAEVDVRCLFGACSVCKGSGWLEMLGAGLVHPNVLKEVGYDPGLWSGFAFGIGVERVAMLRCGIQDIRQFYENDLRFLTQF